MERVIKFGACLMNAKAGKFFMKLEKDDKKAVHNAKIVLVNTVSSGILETTTG